MSGRPIRVGDDVVRDALVHEPRRGASLELAEEIGARIRRTPQRRPWLPLAGRALFAPDATGGTRAVRLLLVAALALAAATALLVAGLRQAPPLPGNGLIVVGSDRVGLHLADPVTGTSRVLVAPWRANPSGRTNRSDLIAVAPGGDRLAYIVASVDAWSIPIVDLGSHARLSEIRDDGRGVLPEWRMRWSHDGRRLFLEATVAGVARIVAADASTGDLFDVGSPDAVSRDVAPSPLDGRVAFVQTSAPFGEDYRLVVRDVDSGAATEPLARTPDGSAVAAAPAWAPDARRLAVTVTRSDGRSAVATVAVDGSGYTIITPWTHEWPAAQWSPDGSRLLVVIVPQGGREADIYTNDLQRAALFLVEPDGHAWRPIGAEACSNVEWSPDGASILYERGTCDASGSPEVRVMRADGSDDRAVWTGDPSVANRLSIGWQSIP